MLLIRVGARCLRECAVCTRGEEGGEEGGWMLTEGWPAMTGNREVRRRQTATLTMIQGRPGSSPETEMSRTTRGSRSREEQALTANTAATPPPSALRLLRSSVKKGEIQSGIGGSMEEGRGCGGGRRERDVRARVSAAVGLCSGEEQVGGEGQRRLFPGRNVDIACEGYGGG